MKKIISASLISLACQNANAFMSEEDNAAVVTAMVKITNASEEAHKYEHTFKHYKYSPMMYRENEENEIIESSRLIEKYSVCVDIESLDKVHGLGNDGYEFPDYDKFYEESVNPPVVHSGSYTYIDYYCHNHDYNEGYDSILGLPLKGMKEKIDQTEYKCATDEVLLVSDKPIKNCTKMSVSVSSIIEL